MDRSILLYRRIRVLTSLFILGLFVSGVTAIPLRSEVDALVRWLGPDALGNQAALPTLQVWLLKVRDALDHAGTQYPLLFYGTDWLAFGHFVIALAFVGALREPVRNSWLFTFGLLACVLVVPYAFLFGALRGIPLWWRLIDCSFGVFGFIPLWFCRRWAAELEAEPGRGRLVPAGQLLRQ